jgi:hypothetical protein
MPFPKDPAERSPKGDHNRRLALGLDLEAFAVETAITPEQLKDYEMTLPNGQFDLDVANRIGTTLERLETQLEPRVDNGDPPADDNDKPAPAQGSATYRA